tara:strand:- start:89 stop:820 length:732 start_codon:yes stop_codon:yes gene_type:complete
MNKINYIITNEIFFEAKELFPQPVIKFIPKWYKDVDILKTEDTIHSNWNRRIRNVKGCPSMIETFKEGLAILAPCDIRISYDEDSKQWFWRTAYDLFPYEPNLENIDFHEDNQMVNFLPSSSSTRKVFKINLPMYLDVPRGYYVRVMPMPFSYNNDWVASPGTYNPNKVSQVNVLIEYTSKKNEILIPQGTPLAVHVPYKKEKFNYNFEQYDKRKHNKILYGHTLLTQGRFHSSYLRGIKEDE